MCRQILAVSKGFFKSRQISFGEKLSTTKCKTKNKKMLAILICKKLFGAILFLREEIQIFVEVAVSSLSSQIRVFSVTKSSFPYKIPVFSPFPLSIHLIINEYHIKCLTYQPKKIRCLTPKVTKLKHLQAKEHISQKSNQY